MSMKNTSDQIAEYIKENILNGNFKINSKLPSERKIAEQFNVSRIPVRKAIEQLCNEGILKIIHCSSPIIQGFNKFDLFDEREAFNNKDIQQLYIEALKARQLIESEAARLAATNATENERKAIKKGYLESINQLDKLYSGLVKECNKADFEFHNEIIKASHSDLFIQYYKLIPKTIYLNQYFSFKYRTSLKDMIAYHDAIMEAIEKKDGERAYCEMYKHLEEVIRLFENGICKKEGNHNV